LEITLVLSVTPEGASTGQAPDEEIEIIATGEAEEEGYNVEHTLVGTRTDTPLSIRNKLRYQT
jgi:iron complex outermembrane recepter protein